MFKKILLCITIIFIIFTFIACAGDKAEISDNIEKVYAAYHDVDSTDILRKTAELCYYKMDITPKTGMEVKGVSFSAKLKKGTSNFTVKLFVIKNVDVSEETKIEMAQKDVVLTNQYSTVTINSDELYSLTVTDSKQPEGSDIVSVEFYYGGELNKNIAFSLNNISLLT